MVHPPDSLRPRPQQPFMPLVGDVPSQPNARPWRSQPRFAVAASAWAQSSLVHGIMTTVGSRQY